MVQERHISMYLARTPTFRIVKGLAGDRAMR
jgi:hypothetical protein